MAKHFGNNRGAWDKENGLESLQTDLDECVKKCNNEKTHHGKSCEGETPMETFMDGKKLFNQKNLAEHLAAYQSLTSQRV
jgi:hypothetical protein